MNVYIFVIEAIVLVIVFTFMIIVPLCNNPVWWIHDYPKEIQEEYFKTHERIPAAPLSSLCRYYEKAILPIEDEIANIFWDYGKSMKSCLICGKSFLVSGNQGYCSTECTSIAKEKSRCSASQKIPSEKACIITYSPLGKPIN